MVRARDLAGREVVTERTPMIGAGIRVRPFREGGEQPGGGGGAGGGGADADPEMITLDDERRARLIEAVENNTFMPADAKERILNQLGEPEVPARMVERIESRMGG